ncbi:hypothetical protein M422DRAFT_63753 [Sphaerobolus stellatus SS14]|nr:hypothetical protein M422DRAFT_63753 [Sphaerobolus stellatus SS14]
MDPAFVQNLHGLLQQVTAPDTSLVKAATSQIKNLYKEPQCIPALFEILATSPEPSVRQLAAVELRKIINQDEGKNWQSIDQGTRQTIKDKIVEVTFNEQVSIVRHASARVIAAIAELELPLDLWPGLMPLLTQAATSNIVAQREIASFIIFSVIATIGGEIESQLSDAFKLFSNLIHDPDSLEVRVTSVKALGAVADYIENDQKGAIKQYQEIVPSIIRVLGQTVESNDEKNARDIFDVLETLLIIEVPLISKHIAELVPILLQVAANNAIDDEIRNMTLNALNWTVKYKRTKIQAKNLAATILEGLLPIAAEPVPEDIDEDSPSRCALRVIDEVALNLPASHVFPAMRALMEKYILSSEAGHRRAALSMLATSVEGIAEYLSQNIDDVWIIIDRGLNDPDASVRGAACTAIGCLCQHCEDEVTARHNVLMPAVLQLMNDPATQRLAGVALDSLLEILQDDVQVYLEPIMERLVVLLDTAPKDVQPIIIGAIGSAAHSAGARFQPYFETTMKKLTHFLLLGDSVEETELKGIAMDTLGTFARAVGKDMFRPYFPDVMKQAFVYLESGNSRLAECSFISFGEMAEVFGEEFAPYNSTVVPAIIKSLNQDEAGLDESFNDPTNGGVDEVIDLDELLKTTSAICIEKQHAASVVGTIFVATKSHFLPYVEKVTLALVELLQHFSEDLRKAVYDSLFTICQVFYQLSEPTEYLPGLPVKIPLHQNVQDLIKHILEAVILAFAEDDEKSSVSTLLVGLAEAINEIGPGFVANHLQDVYSMVKQILEQDAICQKDPDVQQDDVVGEELPEEDSMLISAAGDVVAALATALGEQFVEPFQAFLPLLLNYYSQGRTVTDRSSTVGCLGEIIGGMKEFITPFTEPILNILYTALGDSDSQVQSNAAFATGMLIENSNADLSGQYLPVLGALQPLFNVTEGSRPVAYNARDNACGAVARMMIKNTDAVPLGQVLPIWFGSMPLKNDFLENRPVFRAIFHLIQARSGDVAPYIDQILGLFAFVLNPDGPDMLGDESRRAIIEHVAVLNQQIPDKIQAAGLSAYISA